MKTEMRKQKRFSPFSVFVSVYKALAIKTRFRKRFCLHASTYVRKHFQKQYQTLSLNLFLCFIYLFACPFAYCSLSMEVLELWIIILCVWSCFSHFGPASWQLMDRDVCVSSDYWRLSFPRAVFVLPSLSFCMGNDVTISHFMLVLNVFSLSINFH